MKVVRFSKQEVQQQGDNNKIEKEIQVLQTKPYWTTTHKPFHPKFKIHLTQRGKTHSIVALIDTGAGISTISPATVKNLGLTTLPNNNSVIIRNTDSLINKGGWKESVKAIVETSVSKGEATLTVVETHNNNVLLGAD